MLDVVGGAWGSVVCWLFCSVSRLSGSMIFAMEKVKFLHGVGEVTLSGGRLVGVSVAIALPVENGCMVGLEMETTKDRSVYFIRQDSACTARRCVASVRARGMSLPSL